jgi:membrane-bound serine protease (ClpP class)
MVVQLVMGLGLAQAAEQRPVVYVATVSGMIDLGLAPYIERVLSQAQAHNAAAVLLDVNTFGGRVDGAVQIRDALLAAKLPTIAFVNPRAISAGALISLAAEKIVMANAGTMGAAAPVQGGQPGGEAKPAGEKTVSYLRKEFRTTAETRGRDPLVAEAMVDVDVAIDGLVEKGKLLTLTTSEALERGIADARADSIEAALAAVGIENADVRHTSANWAEQLVRWLTHPVVSSLLLTVAMVGVIVELRTPGFGVAGGIGLLSLGLFFWGHWIVALAGWEELLLVAAGIVLLVLELFVVPGFGILGFLGLAGVAAGLVLSLIGEGTNTAFLILSLTRVGAAMAVAVVLSLLLLRFLPRLPGGRSLILETRLATAGGYASPPESDRTWLHCRGRTLTPLRPAGIVEIDGERVDVVSTGEPVDAGETVEVVRVDGNRIVVRHVAADNREVDR